MVKSKTKISKQTEKKSNLDLVETIRECKKNKEWINVAHILSRPRRILINKNLGEINEIAKDGETILIPGKVLSMGEVSKKIKIIALGFSKSAEEKLLKAKADFSYIIDEIKKNPNGKGIKIIS
ncbi:50S ribosomal protein L18e [Candidatus Pacearchaeota archaeon CG10_big_fil_rev_8_21_14_0_10_34_12]|nr:MAG: 50S ribosomal protein L18e [Candidatus Pacearchaeota archaeon CG10_big_fil_rev_8_21_14_0_10_34_12]